ncbi:MAG: hypothetical protein ACN4GW_01775 [Desulforhopalus sp.]
MSRKKKKKRWKNLLTPFSSRFIVPAYVDSATKCNNNVAVEKVAENTSNPR